MCGFGTEGHTILILYPETLHGPDLLQSSHPGNNNLIYSFSLSCGGGTLLLSGGLLLSFLHRQTSDIVSGVVFGLDDCGTRARRTGCLDTLLCNAKKKRKNPRKVSLLFFDKRFGGSDTVKKKKNF